jgi:hypothetical protein
MYAQEDERISEFLVNSDERRGLALGLGARYSMGFKGFKGLGFRVQGLGFS